MVFNVSEKHVTEEVSCTFCAIAFSYGIQISEASTTVPDTWVSVSNIETTDKLSIINKFDLLVVAAEKTTNTSFWLYEKASPVRERLVVNANASSFI
jgi:hypothetical protein